MGIPFIPVRGIMGSDYMRVREDFKVIPNPYGGDDVVVVPAIVPDVAILHGFQADSRGNLLVERKSDIDLAIFASRRVIATVEEVVPEGDLHPTGQHELISWLHFHALVVAPHGAHPTACPGKYGVDDDHIREYLEAARDERSFQKYLERYIFSARDHEEYLSRIGAWLKTRAV
jgi:glutaconate CoA-transferase subunit A